MDNFTPEQMAQMAAATSAAGVSAEQYAKILNRLSQMQGEMLSRMPKHLESMDKFNKYMQNSTATMGGLAKEMMGGRKHFKNLNQDLEQLDEALEDINEKLDVASGEYDKMTDAQREALIAQKSQIIEQRRLVATTIAHNAATKSTVDGLTSLSSALAKGVVNSFTHAAKTALGGGDAFATAASFMTSNIDMANNATQAGAKTLSTFGAATAGAGGKIGIMGMAATAAGGAISFLSTTVSELAKAGIGFMMTQTQQLISGFQQLSGVGAIYAGGMQEQIGVALKAGLTMDQFAKAVSANTENFAKLGVGVGEGSKRLANVMDANSPSGKKLREGMFALGLNAEQQADTVAGAMALMAGPSGKLEASNEVVQQESSEYAKNLKLISDITGKDAKARMEKLRQDNDTLAFNSYLNGLDEKERIKVQTAMNLMSEEDQRAFREKKLYGNIVSSDLALSRATNKGIQANQDAIFEASEQHNLDVNKVADIYQKNTDLVLAEANRNGKTMGLVTAGITADASKLQNASAQYILAFKDADKVKAAIAAAAKPTDDKGNKKTEVELMTIQQKFVVDMQAIATGHLAEFGKATAETIKSIEKTVNALSEVGVKSGSWLGQLDNSLIASIIGAVVPTALMMLMSRFGGGSASRLVGGAGKAIGGAAGAGAEAAGSAVGRGLGSLGDGIKSIGGGIGGGIQGLLTGIGAGLKALANPQTLVGLAALTVAIMGIGKAVEWAAPGIDAIGRSIKGAFEGAGVFVNNMGTAIKSVSEGIATVIATIGASATQVAKALTESIKELSTISALKLIAVAGGIGAVATSMTVFGVGGALAKLISGDGKFDGMVSGIRMFENIDATKLRDVADAMKKLKDSMPSVIDLIKLQASGIIDKLTGNDVAPRAGGVGGAGGGGGGANNPPAVGGGGGTGGGAAGGTAPQARGGLMGMIDSLTGTSAKQTTVGQGPEQTMAGATANGDPAIMKMIKDHEGTRYEPYKDSMGLWTVGVGHLIGDGKTLPDSWNRKFSQEEVDSMFAKDFDYHSKAASQIPGYDKLNNKGQGALTDMTFNMGPAWANKFPRFIDALKSGNIFSMVSELQTSAWFKQVGRRAMDDIALLKDSFGSMKMMADGGITNGPSIAGEAGAEAVVPLPNGRSIPVDMDMSALVEKMDEMIRVMRDHKTTSDRILQASA